MLMQLHIKTLLAQNADSCAAVLEVVRTGMCWLSTANGCWRHGSIQLCMGYCRQRVLLMHLL